MPFDQSFPAACPPTTRSGIPARYLAPEVAAGLLPAGPAADVWALGCAIFRVRPGADLFFDYDTNSRADALRQVVKAAGDLPEEWTRQTRFDDEGFPAAVGGEGGEVFWSLDETRPLGDRVRAIVDEPAGLVVNNGRGEAVDMNMETEMDMDGEPGVAMFDADDATLREPFPAALGSIAWKPTAICVDGDYITAYSDETDAMLEAFPRIAPSEASLLVDLLAKIFTYEPGKRITTEELVTHPWFSFN